MSNLTLDVSKDGLEQHILFFDYRLIIKHSLHRFVITLISVHRKSLELLLIFSIVENGLR